MNTSQSSTGLLTCLDGDQCVSKPCKNGAMCSDSVGGYDCVCKTGFSGVHCENGERRMSVSSALIDFSIAIWGFQLFCFHVADETQCTMEPDKGCSQFCKPGYTSYQCSCALGWKLSSSDRNKCQPAGTLPHIISANTEVHSSVLPIVSNLMVTVIFFH